ncbi:MAG: HigA family addiction module antidote protein [Armatimonadetes bacterium]|nr:HigA family addiction module antidote protein [Armatimonadota bacterium]
MKKKQTIICPGEVVREELDERGWTQQEFADILGRSRQLVSSFLHGRSNLTFDLAVRLEAALDVPAATWLKMESLYRSRLEKTKIDAIRSQVSARAKRLGVAETRAGYRR